MTFSEYFNIHDYLPPAFLAGLFLAGLFLATFSFDLAIAAALAASISAVSPDAGGFSIFAIVHSPDINDMAKLQQLDHIWCSLRVSGVSTGAVPCLLRKAKRFWPMLWDKVGCCCSKFCSCFIVCSNGLVFVYSVVYKAERSKVAVAVSDVFDFFLMVMVISVSTLEEPGSLSDTSKYLPMLRSEKVPVRLVRL